MKSINLKLPFSINELLNIFEQLNTEDLKRVAEKTSALLNKRSKPSPEEQEKLLVARIKRQLPEAFFTRFEILKSKTEAGELTKIEHLEMTAYVEEIEAFDDAKIKALQELAKLKKVSFVILAEELQAFSRTNG